MQIQNYSPESGNNISPQAFGSESPVEKEYLRSFVPTMSSLLAGFGERKQLSDNIATYICSTEAETERKETPKASSSTDNLSSYCRRQGRNCFYCITRLSEDTVMREDENGIRSHYCPFDIDRDEGRIQDANFLDRPMNVGQPTLMAERPSESANEGSEVTDIDAPTAMIYAPVQNEPSSIVGDSSLGCVIRKGSCMQYSSGQSSDDIPVLMGEMPSESDNEDSAVSDIDASTSMIYPPLHNYPSSIGEDSSLECILQKGRVSPSFSFRQLDQKTMDDWTADYSDGSDFDIPYEVKIGTYVLGEESDMEEFNETPEVEKEKSDSIANDKDIESNLQDDESPKIRPPEEKDEQAEKGEDSDKCVDEGEKRTPDIKPADDSENESKDEGENNSHGVHSPQSSEDISQMESLEAEVQNAMLNATVELNGLKDMQKNPLTISSDIFIDDDFRRRFISDLDFNQMNTLIHEGDNTDSDVERCECKSKVSDIESSRKVETGGIKLSPKAEPDTKDNEMKRPNERKQGLFSMEPVAMNLKKSPKSEEFQSNLATELSFMTEGYHIKEDELFSVTLSMDTPDEVPLTEVPKRSVISEEGENPNLNVKSQCKSSGSEAAAAATIEPKTDIRSQNKLAKLFKSFKKKFSKKA